jgi:hypothetical protein
MNQLSPLLMTLSFFDGTSLTTHFKYYLFDSHEPFIPVTSAAEHLEAFFYL